MVSLSGIPHALALSRFNGNVAPPGNEKKESTFAFIPGHVSAFKLASISVMLPPSSTIWSGREGGVHAVWPYLATLLLGLKKKKKLGGTSCWRVKSSWCCLLPKRCKSQKHPKNDFSPHRRPASPQTEVRGCGCPSLEVGQGWNRCEREGTVLRSWRCICHSCLLPPLALTKMFNADIILINVWHLTNRSC